MNAFLPRGFRPTWPGGTERVGRDKMTTPKNPDRAEPALRHPCNVPGCGRRAYCQQRCQTHHRQWKTRGRIEPIRPYLRRNAKTVKLAGLRLSPECAEWLTLQAQGQSQSLCATISQVLEDGHRRARRISRRPRDKPSA